MHHLSEAKDAVELLKVGGVGLIGFFASINFADANLFMSFMVGFATFLFVVTKTTFMIVDRRERKKEKSLRRGNYLD